jgi:hypothetical protein
MKAKTRRRPRVEASATTGGSVTITDSDIKENRVSLLPPWAVVSTVPTAFWRSTIAQLSKTTPTAATVPVEFCSQVDVGEAASE